MSDVSITIDAGVCRFKTVVNASMTEEGEIAYKIKSECPAIRELGKNLKPVSMFDAVAIPINENPIYKMCGPYIPHAACPVPCAMVKASEVAVDLALKRDVSFKIE
ncbi:MAG: hypothetical protein WCR96_03040 [Candidatus Methanomethylophilaceae archaeon]|jgi:hypothetical protein